MITIEPNKPGQRFRDALAVQEGASNPIAVARSLVRAIEEVRDQGGNIDNDPAVRLICHQLAHILRVTNFDDYVFAMVACEKAVKQS